MKMFGGNGGHANYKKNLERTMYADPTQCCVYCGKSVGKGRLSVFLNCHNQAVAADETLPDFLGYYPIGSDCAKKAKKEGIPVYLADDAGKFTAA